jgi:hypothetical protein
MRGKVDSRDEIGGQDERRAQEVRRGKMEEWERAQIKKGGRWKSGGQEKG